jgi:Leucine-rich repeat (LRR) protein
VLQLTLCFVLSELPQSIGDLSSLEELLVFDNKELKELPSTIGQLSSLKQLHCNGCELTGTYLRQPVDLAHVLTHVSVLPESIGQISSLTYLNCEENKLTGRYLGQPVRLMN